jgi:predicted small secreted protein
MTHRLPLFMGVGVAGISQVRSLMRTRVTLLLAIAFLATLAGCNTIRGMGEDIQALGRGIQRTLSK